MAGKGGNTWTGDGGPATSAYLGRPSGLYVDGPGNIYIADTNNDRIRKVSPSGIITTVAGSGSEGYSGDGGPATAAGLNHPMGVYGDTSGNIYIADTYNNRIRKVSASGTISTVAGNGTAGFGGDGGLASASIVNSPTGVYVDTIGNLYIADNGNQRIRKVSETLPPVTTAAATGYAFGNWSSAATINVTLTSNDASGIATGYPKFCMDITNTCAPATSYTDAIGVTCASGTSCTHYVRYSAQDKVSNQ